MAIDLNTTEIIEIIVSFTIMLLYFAIFLFMVLFFPAKTTLGVNLIEKQRYFILHWQT
tara:strand:+ start:1307 stop:1480 length:174 start_codon:yes stop_codon:yes gene_type:complete